MSAGLRGQGGAGNRTRGDARASRCCPCNIPPARCSGQTPRGGPPTSQTVLRTHIRDPSHRSLPCERNNWSDRSRSDRPTQRLLHRAQTWRGPGEKGDFPVTFATIDHKEGQEVVEDDLELVRTKRFDLKPMDSEEAILQMNLLGHSFYVFNNAETDRTNVVYKRKDGRYGLIETH